jgi:hypothetical protein
VWSVLWVCSHHTGLLARSKTWIASSKCPWAQPHRRTTPPSCSSVLASPAGLVGGGRRDPGIIRVLHPNATGISSPGYRLSFPLL